MSFIDTLKNAFQDEPARKNKSEVDKLFIVMASMTKSVDVVENYISQQEKLRKKEKSGFNIGYIKLYLTWEEFILNSQPSTGKRLSKEEFRKFISQNIDTSKIKEEMRIIFLSERELTLHMYEKFIQYFSEYVTSNLGHDSFLKIARESNPGSVFDNLKTNKNGFDFTKLNSLIIPNRRDFHIIEITRIFKGFVALFYNKIELSLGAKIAHSVFKDFFEDVQETYDTNIAAILLRVTPERVLNLDEWLSLLSKTELEREVKTKTSALNDLNSSLEQKVSERTKELLQANEELKKIDIIKSEFISVAAHQLRTPLSGIKWTIEMLVKEDLGTLNDEQKSFLKKAYSTNENLIAIINNMLNSDLIIKGKEDYVCSKTNIYDIIDEVVFQIEPIARGVGIEIIRDKRNSGLESIIADGRKLHMVILNLIDNAVKYGGGNSKVTITVENSDGDIKVCVSDRGIGIPEEQKNNIFGKFFRADNAVRVQANGSGLGLFISKNIIDKHGGTIWFEKNKDKGTKFCFTIPKKPKGTVVIKNDI
ncbi:MAG: signal transduction histidine kinase [Candidatus Paceibacteria bacterium]|jgi:signal transduction histidine kinase